MTSVMLIAAAAAALLWPTKKPSGLPSLVPTPPTPTSPKVPTFLEATSALADVRRRLLAGELLGDAERKAIDTLQLALTAGSEK